MLYDLIHVLVGALTVGLVLIHPALTIVAFLAFIFYQFREAQTIGDLDFADVREWMIGYFIAGAGLLGWFIRSIMIRGGF